MSDELLRLGVQSAEHLGVLTAMIVYVVRRVERRLDAIEETVDDLALALAHESPRDAVEQFVAGRRARRRRVKEDGDG